MDNKKLALLGGYKTAASANTCWYNLRKKLFASQDGSVTAPDTAAAASPAAGKARSSSTKKKRGKSDGAAGIASPAGKNEASSGSKSGNGKKKKRAADFDDDAATSAMDETPSKKLKAQKTMIEEGSEALSTAAAAGSDAGVKYAEGSVKGSDYVVPKLEPMDDMEDVLTGEEGMGSKESSEGVVKVKEEDTQIMPTEYADSVTSVDAGAATGGKEQGDEDAGLRFFEQMREFAE